MQGIESKAQKSFKDYSWTDSEPRENLDVDQEYQKANKNKVFFFCLPFG